MKLKMAKTRSIGDEILQGLRELKRGEHGRVSTLPSVASIRAKSGLAQAAFAKLLGVSLQPCKIGSRAAVFHPVGFGLCTLLFANSVGHGHGSGRSSDSLADMA